MNPPIETEPETVGAKAISIVEPKPTRADAVRTLILSFTGLHNAAGTLAVVTGSSVIRARTPAFHALVRQRLADPNAAAVTINAASDAVDLSSLPAYVPTHQAQASRPSVSPCTDTANAERFARMHRGRALFVPEWHSWLVFDGTRWAKDPAGVLTGALGKETVRSIYREALSARSLDARQELASWAVKSEEKRQRTAMIELARSEPGMFVSYTALDVDPWLFNVANGTIDLRTGKLRPHRASDLLTKLSPVAFDPSATCERFERFLSEIMCGDSDSVLFLRRWLGYSLTGDVREHALCFWFGETGGNGKSTLTELSFYVFGDYAQRAAPDLLFRSARSDRHPTEIADLFRARLVVCNETSHDRSWDLATVKDLTGGDILKARRMREDFWSFEPTHKVVVFGNNKPRIETTDGGMQRRLRLVPFEVTFRGNPDKSLQATLRAEAPGVLALLVKACLEWQRHGLPESAAIADATASYFAEEDVVGQFVAERCDLNPLGRISCAELRAAIEAWAVDKGLEKPTPKQIARWLAQHVKLNPGDKLATTSRNEGGRVVNAWRGIRLKPEASQDRRAQGGDA